MDTPAPKPETVCRVPVVLFRGRRLSNAEVRVGDDNLSIVAGRGGRKQQTIEIRVVRGVAGATIRDLRRLRREAMREAADAIRQFGGDATQATELQARLRAVQSIEVAAVEKAAEVKRYFEAATRPTTASSASIK